MAIGLFDAGFLGAICISLASSWAFGEVFGWAHSLNNKIRSAVVLRLLLLRSDHAPGSWCLIPGAPLVLITLFVQVIAVTLLPAALVFLILLLNDKETMGDISQHALAEHHQRHHRGRDHRAVDAVRHQRAVPEAVRLGAPHEVQLHALVDGHRRHARR